MGNPSIQNGLRWVHVFVYFAMYRLLIPFVYSLDPDKARQNVGPKPDPKLFDTLMVFLKEFFEKVDLTKKNQQTTS